MRCDAGKVVLKAGREKPVTDHHPWIFSGAIERVDEEPADGAVVRVVSRAGEFLARGYINQRSQITVRLLTWIEDEAIDAAFWLRRLAQAIGRRQGLLQNRDTTACRLVHAESDLLPGLIVDRYGDYLVVQILTLGMDVHRTPIVSTLAEIMQPAGIYERSDVDVREKENLPMATGVVAGSAPPDLLEIRENGRLFQVDIKRGQKTGFYLDQRDNRAQVLNYSHAQRVLNAFAYTGGFAAYAASAGASDITNVDSSAEALALAERNVQRNASVARKDEYITGDVFSILRQFREQKRDFDLVILDPPKFAYSRSQVPSACRGYKDINLLAMQLLRPDGILFTMSCSGLVSPDLFQKVVFGASIDACRDAQVIGRLSQPDDHPVLLAFPEGQYLKGLVCRVL